MLKEEFYSSLFTLLDFEIWRGIWKSSSVDSCFARFESCERGIDARSVLLDPARGIYALPPLSLVLASSLFYLAGFSFCLFCGQVGPFHFVAFASFQLLFLVAVC